MLKSSSLMATRFGFWDAHSAQLCSMTEQVRFRTQVEYADAVGIAASHPHVLNWFSRSAMATEMRRAACCRLQQLSWPLAKLHPLQARPLQVKTMGHTSRRCTVVVLLSTVVNCRSRPTPCAVLQTLGCKKESLGLRLEHRRVCHLDPGMRVLSRLVGLCQGTTAELIVVLIPASTFGPRDNIWAPPLPLMEPFNGVRIGSLFSMPPR